MSFKSITLYFCHDTWSVIFFQPQKLVEEECFKSDLVKMMFTEDWASSHDPQLSSWAFKTSSPSNLLPLTFNTIDNHTSIVHLTGQFFYNSATVQVYIQNNRPCVWNRAVKNKYAGKSADNHIIFMWFTLTFPVSFLCAINWSSVVIEVSYISFNVF